MELAFKHLHKVHLRVIAMCECLVELAGANNEDVIAGVQLLLHPAGPVFRVVSVCFPNSDVNVEVHPRTHV